MKTILALDLGTRFGWAYRDEKGMIKTGNTVLKVPKYTAFLKCLVGWSGVDVVAYEDVNPAAHVGGAAAQMYGGYKGLVLSIFPEARGYAIGTIKKHATGSGNASKKMMVAAVPYILHITDENEADAYWTLQTAIEVLENEIR